MDENDSKVFMAMCRIICKEKKKEGKEDECYAIITDTGQNIKVIGKKLAELLGTKEKEAYDLIQSSYEKVEKKEEK